MYVYRIIYIFLFLSMKCRNGCFAEKTHFSKWIKTDSANIYIFETILNQGLGPCIEICKAKKMCEYINFNINANACSLIGVRKIEELSPGDSVEKKKGFILGKKMEWDLTKYQACNDCKSYGVCNQDEQPPNKYTVCKNSGCGPPESIPFTVFHGNMFSIGNKVKYQCQEGYTDVSRDTVIVTCQTSGNWSTPAIKCVPGVRTCFKNSCYLLDETPMNWTDGKSYCQSLGGYMADMKTESEYNYIKDKIFSTVGIVGTYTWLGATDEQKEDTYIWLDGTLVEYGFIKWDIEEPNGGIEENCLIYFSKDVRNGALHDARCSLEYAILCEF